MTDQTPAATAAPGWYPVAAGSAEQRWWDGTQWTDHVYDPATAVAARAAALRAPEGTKPGTVWIWLLAASPALALLFLIPLTDWMQSFLGADLTNPEDLFRAEFSPLFGVVVLGEFVFYAILVVLSYLDWRALKHRGIERPFHWAWTFLEPPIIYVIGRAVVARRRTGSGMAPLWLWVGLEVAAFIVSFVISSIWMANFLAQFSNLVQQSGGVS